MSWRRSQERAKSERRKARRERVRPVSPALSADEDKTPHRVLLDVAERNDFNRNRLNEDSEQ